MLNPIELIFILDNLKTLKPMENEEKVEVKVGTRKKKGTFPAGTILRFL